MSKARDSKAPAGPGGPPPKKRTIVLRLTAREKADNADAIRELREVLRSGAVGLRVMSADEVAPAVPPPAPPPAAPPERNLVLEVKIGDDVRVLLDTKAAAAPAPKADPEKADEIKKGLWKLLKDAAKAGWRVTVLAGIAWARGKLAG